MCSARADALLRFQKERLAQITAGFRTPAQIAAYLLVAEKARHLTPAQIENVSREHNLNPLVLLRWCGFLNQAGAKGGPLPARWQTLATLSPEEFKNRGGATGGTVGRAARRRRFAHAACRSAPGNASAGPARPRRASGCLAGRLRCSSDCGRPRHSGNDKPGARGAVGPLRRRRRAETGHGRRGRVGGAALVCVCAR